MVSYKYDRYHREYDYPPDLARALELEELNEQLYFAEAAKREEAKKTPPSTDSGE
jgi:hypothetical protein